MPTGTSARSRSRTLSRSSSSRSPFAVFADGAVLRAPPPALLDDPAALPDEQAAGRQLRDAREGGPRRARAPEREHVVDAGEVGSGGHLPGGEQRLGLRAEHEAAVVEQGVVQRAHAEAVAHERQPPSSGLPPGERELAVEPVERGEALALEQAQDDLGVAGRRERLAAPRELGPQLGVVVDLAVVDEDAASRGGLERLPAAREVEDREPCRDEAGARVEGEPEAVRARDGESPAPSAAAPPRRPVADACGRTMPAIPHMSVGGIEEDRWGVQVLGRDAPSLDLPVGGLDVLGLEADPTRELARLDARVRAPTCSRSMRSYGWPK